jgi:hypothetical protein
MYFYYATSFFIHNFVIPRSVSIYLVLHTPLQLVCLHFFLREHKNSVAKINFKLKIYKDSLSIGTVVTDSFVYLLVTGFSVICFEPSV